MKIIKFKKQKIEYYFSTSKNLKTIRWIWKINKNKEVFLYSVCDFDTEVQAFENYKEVHKFFQEHGL